MAFWNQHLGPKTTDEEDTTGPLDFTAEEIMALVDGFTKVAEMYASQKAILVNHGFTPEQAGDIVVSLRQEAAADALAVANGFKKPE